MTTTATAPCVSITTGALRPSSRVNYTFGMVLGLDDFQQEQEHHFVAAALHQRGLHGYGVVSGLGVDVDGVTVNVSPGVAVDRWGRTFTVPVQQCADLVQWLKANPPDPEASTDNLVVYVRGRYDQCLDDLRPLPAQPCTSSDTPQAPARIRDAWTIELAWEPPDDSAWTAAQAYADLLRTVDVVPGATQPGDLDELRTALDGIPAGTSLPTRRYRLGAADLRASLDALDRHWTARICPQLAPDPAAPDPAASQPAAGDPAANDSAGASGPASASILLGAIPIPAGQALDAGPFTANDDNRPVLLHTQLIQELALLGVPRTPVESLLTVRALSGSTAVAWVHEIELDLSVTSPPTDGVQLLVDGVIVALTAVGAVPDGSNGTLVTLTSATGWNQGALVEVRLLLDTQLTTSGETLRAALDASALAVLDQMADHVSGYTIASGESGRPVRELLTPIDITDDRLVLAVDGVEIVDGEQQVWPELTVDDNPVGLQTVEVLPTPTGSVLVIHSAEPWPPSSRLRVSLRLDDTMTTMGTLRQALDATGADYVGRSQDTVDRVMGASPRLPFTLGTASAVPYSDGSEGSALSLWLHVDNPEPITLTVPALRVIREGSGEVLCRVQQDDDLGRVWRLTPEQSFQPGERLAVVLDLAGEAVIGDAPLGQWLDDSSLRPVDVSDRTLTVYAVVPPRAAAGVDPLPLPERTVAVVTAWSQGGGPPLIKVWFTPNLDPRAAQVVEPELVVLGVNEDGGLAAVEFQAGWERRGWNLFENVPYDSAWVGYTQLVVAVPKSTVVEDLAGGGGLIPLEEFAANQGLAYRGETEKWYQVEVLITGPIG